MSRSNTGKRRKVRLELILAAASMALVSANVASQESGRQSDLCLGAAAPTVLQLSPTPPADRRNANITYVEAASGTEVAAWLFTAAQNKSSSSALAVPRREALSDYFGQFLFYDFRPALFWPHYPDRWQTGMRNVLARAIAVGYERENLNHAVCLMPLFFTREQAGELYDLPSLIKAANYDWISLFSPDGPLHHAGVRFWAQAVWAAAGEERRQEIVDALFVRPLLGQRRPLRSWKEAQALPRSTIRNSEDLIPFRAWLKDHRAKMWEFLRSESHDLRQFTLLWAISNQDKEGYGRHFGEKEYPFKSLAAKTDFLVDPADPRIIPLLIEGLRDDEVPDNHYLCSRLLADYSATALPAVRKAFRESTDGQQKSLLCGILIAVKDAPSRAAVLDYLWRLVAEKEAGPVPACHTYFDAQTRPARIHQLNELLLPAPAYSGRIRWAARHLIVMGPPARDFILAHLKSGNDPQQAAVGLLVLEQLNGLQFVRWSPRLVGLLARGLEDNNVRDDLGYCAAALKLGKPEALDALRRIAAVSKDRQVQIACEVLTPYLEGNLQEYKAQKAQYGGDQTFWRTDAKYWEFPVDPYWVTF